MNPQSLPTRAAKRLWWETVDWTLRNATLADQLGCYENLVRYWRKELGKPKEPFYHGHAKRASISPTYSSWKSMRARCNNPKSTMYKQYGAVGITVCERWDKFQNFLSDMGERSPGTSIDRIDSKGNYEPSNCRWATRAVQNLNRRSSRPITLNGETKYLKEWCSQFGICHSTVIQRERYGWSTEKAITTPVNKNKRNKRSYRYLPSEQKEAA